ncbi:MAG TPA: HAD family phosphatase [Gammaproteobacteria bacterium]
MRDIVFDLGGVLIDWDPRYLLRDHLGGAPDEVELFLREICTPQWHARLDAGMPFATLTRELAARFPEHSAWIERYGADWERMFRGAFPECVAYLEGLRRRGYRLHALSNYPAERIRFLYDTFPFMAEFHTVVLSGLVRATKPDESLYRYLLRRIGAASCLFIDDREENVIAARRCGMEAVLFRREDGVEALSRIVDAFGRAEQGSRRRTRQCGDTAR